MTPHGGTCNTERTEGNKFSRRGSGGISSASFIKDSEICDPKGFSVGYMNNEWYFPKCEDNIQTTNAEVLPQGGRKTRKSRKSKKSRKSRKVQRKKGRKSRK